MPKNITTYNAGLYCRLSKDDERHGESVSIITQRIILERVCNEQRFDIYDVYVDDGYSGLNFERPAFQRLLRDIEDGKMDIVLTKDLIGLHVIILRQVISPTFTFVECMFATLP